MTSNEPPLRVGDTLYGYCGGEFGRDFWGPAKVEAIGADWVVVRGGEFRTGVWFYEGNPEQLIEYKTPEPEIDE